jgi:hypothetical protein
MRVRKQVRASAFALIYARSHGEQSAPDLATFVAQRWEPWQVLTDRRGGAKEPTRNHKTAKQKKRVSKTR